MYKNLKTLAEKMAAQNIFPISERNFLRIFYHAAVKQEK
jgi:hypothetical protein